MTRGRSPVALTVVIVSWNTRALLERCLCSIQDDVDFARLGTEIIVVDNASSDGTPEMLRECFPDVSLIELTQNLGFAAATNIGLRQSRGAAMLLLNPDTEIRCGALATMLETLYSMPHVGLVSGLLLNPDGSLQSSGYRFPGLAQAFLDFFPFHPRLIGSTLNGRVSPDDRHSPYAIDHPLGACMLVRREVIERVGLLDESFFMYSEEIDWCRRIRDAGWTILMTPRASIIHHGGQSTRQMPEEMFLQLHRSRALYFSRHNGRLLVGVVALIARAAALRAKRRARTSPLPFQQSSDTLEAVADLYWQAAMHGT